MSHKLSSIPQKMRGFGVPIAIAITFYVFGFFVIANLLMLSGREIVIGLIAGAVGGITTLVAIIFELGDRGDEPAYDPV